MARIAYPSDLKDAQWRLVERRIPAATPGGRYRSVNMREVLDGILYLLLTGCSWRQLPHDFPPRAQFTTSTAAFGWMARGRGFRTPSAIESKLFLPSGDATYHTLTCSAYNSLAAIRAWVNTTKPPDRIHLDNIA